MRRNHSPAKLLVLISIERLHRNDRDRRLSSVRFTNPRLRKVVGRTSHSRGTNRRSAAAFAWEHKLPACSSRPCRRCYVHARLASAEPDGIPQRLAACGPRSPRYIILDWTQGVGHSTLASMEKPSQTPAALGYRMPAEWEPHAATWLSWPRREGISFPDSFDRVMPALRAMVEALIESEQVCINIRDATHEAEAREVLRGLPTERISFHLVPTNEPWCRDHGPIFLTRHERWSRSPPNRAKCAARGRAGSTCGRGLGLQCLGKQISAMRF